MKVLLFLWGESYRNAWCGQMRDRGNGDYMRRQILASKSHIKLIESLQEKGYETDVIINSYRLNDQDDTSLYEFYNNKSHLLETMFHYQIFPSEMMFFQSMFEKSKEYIDKYDFLLFVRIDLYLKKYCLDNFSPDSQKIVFAHIDSNSDVTAYNENKSMLFQIGQVFISIPKSFFHVIFDYILFDAEHPHYFRHRLRKENIPSGNIGFLVSSPFVCSTCTGWNPLYIQVGRPYSKWYTKDDGCSKSIEYFFDIEKDEFVHDIAQTIEKWKDEIEKDSLEENLESLQENTFQECLN